MNPAPNGKIPAMSAEGQNLMYQTVGGICLGIWLTLTGMGKGPFRDAMMEPAKARGREIKNHIAMIATIVPAQKEKATKNMRKVFRQTHGNFLPNGTAPAAPEATRKKFKTFNTEKRILRWQMRFVSVLVHITIFCAIES
jgi:hypothetical protein